MLPVLSTASEAEVDYICISVSISKPQKFVSKTSAYQISPKTQYHKPLIYMMIPLFSRKAELYSNMYFPITLLHNSS